MTFVQNPTYFLAPNWTYVRGGKIALGNIVVDPLKPHIALTTVEEADLAPTTNVPEKNWRLSLETAASMTLGLWATFLDKIHLNLSAERERIRNRTFTMKSLETVYFEKDPTDEELSARCNHAKVREFMRPESVLCRPVYMITGVKIASGFKLDGEDTATTTLGGEAGGEAAPEVDAGARAEYANRQRGEIGFESARDIVFAYQVVRIKPKGWSKDKKLVWAEYHHRKAFLADGDDAAEEKVEGELEAVTPEDLKQLGSGAEVVEVQGMAVAYKPPKQVTP